MFARRWCLVAMMVSVSASAAHAQHRRRTPETPPATTPTPAPTDPAATPAAPTTPPEVRDQARALFVEGQRAYTEGEYELAVQKWEEAYALDPAPALQYNLAQAYGRLGDFQRELAALRRYVEGLPETDQQAQLSRARIAALETRLTRTGVALAGLDPNAELTVDGAVVPNPADGELIAREPGSHRISSRLRGHRPFEAVIDVIAGRTSNVTVEQAELPAVRPPILAYSLLGAGGAALGTSLATGIIAYRRAPDSFAGTSEGDRLHRLGMTSDIMLGVGAAAAVTGLVMVIIRDRPESDGFDTALHVLPFATAQTGGLVLDGRF